MFFACALHLWFFYLSTRELLAMSSDNVGSVYLFFLHSLSSDYLWIHSIFLVTRASTTKVVVCHHLAWHLV
jgi:hypothetical protein